MDLTGVPGSRAGAVRQFSLDRGDGANALDAALIGRLARELDAAEADPRCRVLLITAAPGVFCTGMNLVAAGQQLAASAGAVGGANSEVGGANSEVGGADKVGGAFFDLLDRLTRAPLMVVSAVDGKAAGGGVGLVAASDLVYATEQATFALPEALWGLLPCCVLPFLARRVGFQRAYAMALTTQPVDAPTAALWGLADEVGSQLATPVRRLAGRAARLDRSTIGDLKRYACGLPANPPDARHRAVAELDRLMALPAVRERLSAFAAHRRYPWEG